MSKITIIGAGFAGQTAALYVGSAASGIAEGVQLARRSLDSGEAARTLERLVAYSGRAAGGRS